MSVLRYKDTIIIDNDYFEVIKALKQKHKIKR